MDNKCYKLINGVIRQIETDFFLGVDPATSTSDKQVSKSYDPAEFEALIEQFRPKPEDNLISIIVSDKWGTEKGVYKPQLDTGFHFIITKIMLEKIKRASLLQNTPSTFSQCFGVPIIEDDDLAEKVLVEAYFRKNPFPLQFKDNYLSDCEN
jgi:hypothetical protein